jgi:ElaA protein
MTTTWSWCEFSELTTGQLYDVLALRQQVFVVEQSCVYLDADGYDDRCAHGLGYRDGSLVAYARIVPPGLKYAEPSIGRVVTARAARGRGLGRELMDRTLAEVARRYPGQPVRIMAQAYLGKFYRALGFEAVGAEFLDDGIPHIEMVRGGKAGER